MSADHRAVVHRFYSEVFEGGNLDLIDEMLTDDFVDHEAPPDMPNGRDGAKEMLGGLRQAFPDLRVTVEDTIVEGDRVAVRARMTGTHQADYMGIPATGNSVDMPLIDMMEFRDGRISQHWGVTDFMAMMMQLGVIDQPAP
jgi:steroid delta-isomerase-like uncharacterized protein